MRIGVDAREAWRPEPRGIGLYVRHLMREFAALAPDDRFLLYHQLTLPAGAIQIPPNMQAMHTDMPGGRWHGWERLQMPWRLRRDQLDVYHGTYNTLPLEIYGMTTNVTTPVLYALGTVTTVVSFIVIAIALGSIVIIGLILFGLRK